jgi:putative transposase
MDTTTTTTKASKPRKTYTKEFKQQAVALARRSEIGFRRAAADLGINASMLRDWDKKPSEEGSDAFRGNGVRTEQEARIASLEREIRTLREERDILKKRRNSSSRSGGEVRLHRGAPAGPMWRLRTMCRTLAVSPSGYCCWRSGREPPRRSSDRALGVRITAIHEESGRTYGSPRIHQELKARGERINRKRVERIMRLEGISVQAQQRCVVTTDSDHDLPIAPNLLEQNFTADRSNQKWVSDITYIPTGEGWLFLAGTIDLFSRKVVGWAMDRRMDRSLVLKALDMAIQDRAPASGLIHHSDRGSQYASSDFRKALTDAGILASMSRKACCYDNAVVESLWHSLKTELVHRRQFATRAEARTAIFAYIAGCYNRIRRHSTLGYLPPDAFEQAERTGQAA